MFKIKALERAGQRQPPEIDFHARTLTHQPYVKNLMYEVDESGRIRVSLRHQVKVRI